MATFWPRTPVLYLAVNGDLAAISELRDNGGPRAPPPTGRRGTSSPHLTLDQRIEPGRLPHAHGCVPPMTGRPTASNGSPFSSRTPPIVGNLWPRRPGQAGVVGRGSLDLELSVVERPDPVVAAWADEQWAGYSRQRYGEAVRPITPYALVARIEGRPRFADGEVEGPVLRIGRLIVSPQWRDLGVGSQLLRALERLGLERGCVRVRLETLKAGTRRALLRRAWLSGDDAAARWREEHTSS